MTLEQQIERLQQRRLTAVELVSDALRAAQDWQGTVNAFVRVDAESALAAAEASDKRRSEGQSLSIVDGIPLALKDMFDRPGYPCRFGSRFLQDPTQDPATIVQALQDAGTIILGALNMAEFALGPTGHNSVFGHCRNPWNPEHITGGSSSGAAAAVAVAIVTGSIGSDSGGSIRIPAACCGVVGLKPTHGRVSVEGVMPLTPSLDCVGPFGRTAADCERLFRLIASPGPRGPDTSARSRFEADISDLAHVQLAYPIDAIAGDTSPEIISAIDTAADQFARLGARIVPSRLPNIPALHALAETIQHSETSAVHRERLRQHRALYTPHILRRVEAGLSVMASDYIHALEQRAAYRSAFVAETLGNAHALMVPVLGLPVPRIDATDEAAVGGSPEIVARMTRWTRWVSYLGVPALSLPCGFDQSGLPIGLQLVGRPFSEMTLLKLARCFQDVTEWHSKTPSPGDSTFAH
jgi:aspartyl-tRNA(Asn)/glutamyl-tRNA(Gln) amidotransferase subunit A